MTSNLINCAILAFFCSKRYNKSMIGRILTIVMAFMFLFTLSAQSAVIKLKNGTVLRGLIMDESDSVIVLRDGGQDSIVDVDQVESVEADSALSRMDIYNKATKYYNENSDQIFLQEIQPQESLAETQLEAGDDNWYHVNKLPESSLESAHNGIQNGVYHGLSQVDKELDDLALDAQVKENEEMLKINNEMAAAQLDDFNALDEQYDAKVLDLLDSLGYDVEQIKQSVDNADKFWNDKFDNPINNNFSM